MQKKAGSVMLPALSIAVQSILNYSVLYFFLLLTSRFKPQNSELRTQTSELRTCLPALLR
jgi:hypothetical protein